MSDITIQNNEARVNVTWAGQNGDMLDPVGYDSPPDHIKAWVQEAVRTGSVPGIRADAAASFQDFVVDRFPASAEVPYNRIHVRPKTPFGNPIW